MVCGVYVTAAPGGDPHGRSTRIIMARRSEMAKIIDERSTVHPSFFAVPTACYMSCRKIFMVFYDSE
jgi:hypothetical protein